MNTLYPAIPSGAVALIWWFLTTVLNIAITLIDFL